MMNSKDWYPMLVLVDSGMDAKFSTTLSSRIKSSSKGFLSGILENGLVVGVAVGLVAIENILWIQLTVVIKKSHHIEGFKEEF